MVVGLCGRGANHDIRGGGERGEAYRSLIAYMNTLPLKGKRHEMEQINLTYRFMPNHTVAFSNG